MLNKKGAVEFSMTTIIVVIIGVIILAIAIPWITGTLNKAGGLTDAAFDSALKQLQGDPTPSEPVVLSQDSFTLKRGEQAALVVRYLNRGGESLIFTDTGDGVAQWFTSDNSPAEGKVYDWRAVLKVPDNAVPADSPYFARAEIGTGDTKISIPIVINVE